MGLFSIFRERLRRSGTQADNPSWVSGGSYTISIPAGKWHIGQKITLRQDGTMNTTYPVITATTSDKQNQYEPIKNAKNPPLTQQGEE